MTDLFQTAAGFLGALKSSEIILSLVTIVLVILVLYLLGRNMSLSDEKEALQKDYAPRRKRVYQAYANWLSDVYSGGLMDITPERQEALRAFYFDGLLWSSDRVVGDLRGLQALLNTTGEVAPERFEKLLFTALMNMREDMGFRNKGLSWTRLRDLVIAA